MTWRESLRSMASLVVSAVGGVFLGFVLLIPNWRADVHVTAATFTLAGVLLAVSGYRTIALAGSLAVAAVTAVGILLRGSFERDLVNDGAKISFTEADVPSILLVAVVAVVSFLLLRTHPQGARAGREGRGPKDTEH